MERLTNEAVKVEASVDGMTGPLVDLTNMKPRLLDVILNGPTLISVSKNVLRSIIRQLYSALAAYEDTGLTPEQCENAKVIIESVFCCDFCDKGEIIVNERNCRQDDVRQIGKTVGFSESLI